VTGKQIAPVYEPPRKGDVRHSLADISRAQELVDYRVEVPFEEGLRRTIEWYKTKVI
jgi:nucleoside-diphosphate-sugar epimerase